MSTPLRIVLLCGFGILSSVRPAGACTCAVFPVCTTFWDADAVFIGRAQVTSLGPGAQLARFEIEESFRGPAGSVEIVGRGIGGSCDYGFVDDTRYIVFARRHPDGSWKAFLCGSTTPLAEAGEVIRFARITARDTARGGSISGSVFSAERTEAGRLGLHSPLPSVRVVAHDGTRELTTRTDLGGQYEFEKVTPGRYTLTFSAPPGVEPIAPASLDVKGPGACVMHHVTSVRR
jgi:hypothetical protein